MTFENKPCFHAEANFGDIKAINIQESYSVGVSVIMSCNHPQLQIFHTLSLSFWVIHLSGSGRRTNSSPMQTMKISLSYINIKRERMNELTLSAGSLHIQICFYIYIVIMFCYILLTRKCMVLKFAWHWPSIVTLGIMWMLQLTGWNVNSYVYKYFMVELKTLGALPNGGNYNSEQISIKW